MRCDLMNFEWAFNQTIVVEQSRGVESVDDRRVFNGIFVYCARAAPWRDLVGALQAVHGLEQPQRFWRTKE